MNLLDLTGRTALVTGAGQGVGEAIAHHLAAHGASVVVNDYLPDRANRVAEAIGAAGGRAAAVPFDVTDIDAVRAGLAEAASFGTVDVVVNNAGNAGTSPATITGRRFWETPPEQWNAYLGVNLFGVMNVCHTVIPRMIEADNGGRLITIISDAGRQGEAGMEAYAAAKAGAAGLMRSLARGLGRYLVTANCIAIAATRTPAIEAALADAQLMKQVLAPYVIRRVGEPDDAAAMATFLASPSASWITGQTFPVNGGFSFNQ